MNDKDLSKLMTIKECEVRVKNQKKKDIEEFEKLIDKLTMNLTGFGLGGQTNFYVRVDDIKHKLKAMEKEDNENQMS